jgi:hypothetical protein
MTYSKLKFRSNDSKTSPFFQTILNTECNKQIFTYAEFAYRFHLNALQLVCFHRYTKFSKNGAQRFFPD